MKELEIGSGKFKGYYRSDKSIVFKNRPTAEWEYMACGTGRTGLAILAHDHIILQINHEGAINEQGYLVPVCRIHIEYPDDPFSTAEQYNGFTMVHDLKNAVITLTATVSDGTVTVEIRACMQTDMIRVDIMDTRMNPTDMTLWVEVPWPGTCGSFFPGEFHMWHDNGKITSWHDINMASGLSDDSAFTDVLKDRCFGFSIKTEECIAWDGNRIVLDKNKKTNFSVYATACCNRELFLSLIEDKTKLSVFEQEFISRHNDYWDTFWKRMYFETDEQTMLPFLAAYDLYRYFCAVSSGENREFPLRFQIDLLRSTFRFNSWATMQIHSVQTIQAYYGAYKNGDWNCLASLLRDYEKKLPLYTKLCKDIYGHEGVIIPYETNMWGTIHYDKARGPWDGTGKRFKDKNLYHLLTHKWSMYSFEHGLAIIQFFLKVAQAKNDEEIIQKIVIPYAKCLCKFFIYHYKRDNRVFSFDPATSGETWFCVKNPSSWICLFKAFLPELLQLALFYKDNSLEESVRTLLEGLPSIPTGSWDYDEGKGLKICTKTGEEVILPAEEFDRHCPINRENPELYGIWPYCLYGVECRDYDLALRTYNQRLWKNISTGWALDAIWSACLGLTSETMDSYMSAHFNYSVRCPGGFSYEDAPTVPEEKTLPLYPSMQGMGTTVCPIYEMVCSDRSDHILVMPAWPADKPLKIALYSKIAGRVEIDYKPDCYLKIKTERTVEVKCSVSVKTEIKS